MKTLSCCVPRQSVLDRSEDFVVNISGMTELTEKEAAEFLDSNVLTSGMEDLIVQTRSAGRIREGGIPIVDANTVQIIFGGLLNEPMQVVVIG